MKDIHDKMMNRISTLEKSNSEIQLSQDFICTQFDEFNKKIKTLTTENKMFKNEILHLKQKQNKYEEIINTLESKIDSITQEKINNNIIIAGLPECNENPTDISNTIFDKLQVPESIRNEVNEVEFMSNKTKKSTSKSIIVKFKSLKSKEEMLSIKKNNSLTVQQLNIFNTTNQNNFQDNLIYFRDRLTKFKLEIYREAKSLRNKHNIKHLWIKNSTIHMRKFDNSKVFIINSRNDLNILDAHLSVLEENTEKEPGRILEDTHLDSSFVSAINEN